MATILISLENFAGGSVTPQGPTPKIIIARGARSYALKGAIGSRRPPVGDLASSNFFGAHNILAMGSIHLNGRAYPEGGKVGA
jgi:hypothetical protein